MKTIVDDWIDEGWKTMVILNIGSHTYIKLYGSVNPFSDESHDSMTFKFPYGTLDALVLTRLTDLSDAMKLTIHTIMTL